MHRLVESLGLETRGWEILDHWDADSCAIGMTSSRSKGRLVYVSTFDKGTERFDDACELRLDEGEVLKLRYFVSASKEFGWYEMRPLAGLLPAETVS